MSAGRAFAGASPSATPLVRTSSSPAATAVKGVPGATEDPDALGRSVPPALPEPGREPPRVCVAVGVPGAEGVAAAEEAVETGGAAAPPTSLGVRVYWARIRSSASTAPALKQGKGVAKGAAHALNSKGAHALEHDLDEAQQLAHLLHGLDAQRLCLGILGLGGDVRAQLRA